MEPIITDTTTTKKEKEHDAARHENNKRTGPGFGPTGTSFSGSVDTLCLASTDSACAAAGMCLDLHTKSKPQRMRQKKKKEKKKEKKKGNNCSIVRSPAKEIQYSHTNTKPTNKYKKEPTQTKQDHLFLSVSSSSAVGGFGAIVRYNIGPARSAPARGMLKSVWREKNAGFAQTELICCTGRAMNFVFSF